MTVARSVRPSGRARLPGSRAVGIALVVFTAFLGDRAAAAIDPGAATLLAEVRRAAGAVAWQRVELVHVDGTLAAAGMQAVYRADEDVRDGRFDRRSQFPVFGRRDVWDGRTRWHQENSGGVHRMDSAFSGRRNVTDAWLARRGWLAIAGAGAYIGPVTHRTVDGRDMAVMTAIPSEGQPITLFFDAKTFDLMRAERVMPISVQVMTFADYRTLDGIRSPYTIAVDDGDEDVWTLHVRRYAFEKGVHRAVFTRPASPDDWTLAASSVTVPLELHNGALTIAATINGHGPYPFLFDTGGQSALTPQLAAELGLDLVGGAPSGGAGEGLITEPFTRVARVDIGGFHLRDQSFVVLPLPYSTLEQRKNYLLGGLLGLEILDRVAVRIDYPARTMTFTSFASHRFDPADVVTPIRFDDDVPTVQGRLGGRAGNFTLDTGSNGALTVQRRWADRNGMVDDFKRGAPISSYGVAGSSHNWAIRMDDLEIGGRRLDDLIVRYNEDRSGGYTSRTTAGNVGTEVLAHFVIDFDYRQGLMGWRYVPGYVAPPLNRGGFQARKDRPEDFRVVRVSDDSPTARAGVRIGDRIVAIDGVAAFELSAGDLTDRFSGAPGTHVHLDLVRDGAPVVADVVLEEMLPR